MQKDYTIEPKGGVLTVGGEKFPFIFNLGTIAKVQEAFEKPCPEVVGDIFKDEITVETVKKLYPILCNSRKITEKYLLENLQAHEIHKNIGVIFNVWNTGLPDGGDLEDTDPNMTSGETDD